MATSTYETAWYAINAVLLPGEEVLSYSEGYHERGGLFGMGQGGSLRFWAAVTRYRLLTVDEEDVELFGTKQEQVWPDSCVYADYTQVDIGAPRDGWHPLNLKSAQFEGPDAPPEDFTTGAKLLTKETAAVLKAVLAAQSEGYATPPTVSTQRVATRRRLDHSNDLDDGIASTIGIDPIEYRCGQCGFSLGFNEDSFPEGTMCPCCLRTFSPG